MSHLLLRQHHHLCVCCVCVCGGGADSTISFTITSLPHSHPHLHTHIRCPQCEVVSEELHDQGAVLILVLLQLVQFTDGIVKRLLCNRTRLFRVTLDLIVEDREVEGQPETNGVSLGKIPCTSYSLLVGIRSIVGCFLPILSNSELSLVSVVVPLPEGGREEGRTKGQLARHNPECTSHPPATPTFCCRRPWSQDH